MVHEALGIDQFRAERNEALLETFRLRDAAEGRDFFAAQKIQGFSFTGENVLEVQRMMNAFDDGGVGIQLCNPLAEFRGAAIAFGDKNGMGAGEVRRRLAQGAARQQMSVAKRLLAVHQHHVMPASAQFPVLKRVIQQQRVAPEFFNRITPALHAILVHEHDDVPQV